MSNNPTTMRPCRMCASCNLGTYQIKADMLANDDKIVVCRDCKFEQSITKWNTRPIEDQLRFERDDARDDVRRYVLAFGPLSETQLRSGKPPIPPRTRYMASSRVIVSKPEGGHDAK